MVNPIKTYLLYVKVFFKARSEYKVGFVLGIIANFYCYFLTFLSFWVVVSRFQNIAGWDFEDMSILYGLILCSYAVAGTFVWYSVYHLENEITTGKLDLYLTRPMSVLGQLICSRFGDTFIGQIIVTLMFLINALIKNSGILSWQTAAYLICVLFGGVALQMGAMILMGALSFWTLRSERIGELFYYQLRSLTHYPLVIYPGWIKVLLTTVAPWAFINYYPALIVLNKAETKWEYVCGAISPVIGFLFLGASVFVFHCGLRRYTSAGS